MSSLGEQPLLSVKAHVYHIDPKSKKSWIPATAQAVPVSFFFDSARTLYRIISVEGTKAVINSIVTPAMAVTKTSQKFLQWSDARANMVYGLGFSNEEDLNIFLDKFKQVKELSMRQKEDEDQTATLHIAQANGTPSPHSVGSGASGPSATQMRSASPQSSASSNSSPRPAQMGSTTPTLPHAGISQGSLNESQLRVENEKLREALAKSSANSDKWRNQLKCLEDEKHKLLKALEESHTNLTRWENEVSELENRKGGDEGALTLGEEGGNVLRLEVERLKAMVLSLEKRNQAKETEISGLSSRLEDLRFRESASGQNSQEKLQTMESDNRALKLAINDMQEKLSRQVSVNENLKAELRIVKSHVGRQLTDWKKIEDKISELVAGNSG